MDRRKRQTVNKLIIAGLVIGVAALFFAAGLHRYLSLDAIRESQARFQEIYGQHPILVISLFALFYIPVIALNLPGAAVLGVAAGALFGTLTGTIVISFASSFGATLACLLSRYLLRDWVQARFGQRLAAINHGISTEGAFYLFSLRLIPIFPFFLINMAMGLTPLRLWTFYWVSQLGMLPGTALYVNAGSQLARIDSLGGIVSPGLVFSLALLGLFPLAVKKGMTWYRKRSGREQEAIPRQENRPSEPSLPLRKALDQMLSCCTGCGACKTQCAFLQEYGTPKEIIAAHDFTRSDHRAMAFECSLCNLCSNVCPETLDPGRLFHIIRQEAVKTRDVGLSCHNTILGYEQRGSSPLFSYYALPSGCDTVLFPGCTLPGTRPGTTWELFRHLQTTIPELGIVLDCCTKPSHDLGRQAHFEYMFNEMRRYLIDNGVRNVLAACPNCYRTFRQYGRGLEVKTIYEILDTCDLPSTASASSGVVVHDPCPLRDETRIQDSVRSLLTRMGMDIEEMKHRRQRTLCCGEGGSAGFVRPDLASRWGRMRRDEADGRRIVTYCAGCAGFLARQTPTVHIADLLFSGGRAFNGRLRIWKSPFTYLNRLILKHRFSRLLEPAVTRVRNCSPDQWTYPGQPSGQHLEQKAGPAMLQDATVSSRHKG